MTSGLEPAATRVLVSNWRGRYTVPAGGLYPHQWSWDSAFIAIGLRHLSPRRAQQELDSLFSAQWADGRLPHIVFSPTRNDYSPGASFWRSGDVAGAPPVATSGLIQPANHAWAALLVHQADEQESRRRRFLDRAYPSLVRWHDYLSTRRSSPDRLAVVLHPWESGTDNSPLWDDPLSRVRATVTEIPRPDLEHAPSSERPSNAEYGKYLTIAAAYRDTGYDDADAGLLFRVEDPLSTALWARSEFALAEIAEQVGAPGEHHRDRARALTMALDELWDGELGCYLARDLRTGERQRHRTVNGLAPLLLPDLPHADELLATLRSGSFALGRAVMVPSADLTAPTFDRSRYWRGPSWFNIAWLLAMALLERGERAAARELERQMGRLAVASGFAEYVDPWTGEPRGTLSFSWTAALALDLERRFRDQ
ncbi:hypothetical protein [Naasia sp. SYSU D00948]|uniref:MGH1-like glycoside hydrolase domain-containing protein n=1 Tax=Naasia sp. SYSU D00948 TaxID=2817379 RepID=UPI001B30EED3|nr:hypothetical protein [Naasia sp. SYSU D00948]